MTEKNLYNLDYFEGISILYQDVNKAFICCLELVLSRK